MQLEESGFIAATLFIALIALLLVLAARRDARIIREQAQNEAQRVSAEIDLQREEIARKNHALETREDALDSRLVAVTEREANAAHALENVRRKAELVEAELAHVAQLTKEKARQLLLERLEAQEAEEVHNAVVRTAARVERESDAIAKRIVVDALARLSVPTSSEFAIDVFELESEDLKGRIIGKEGRNIRTFEAVAGVDLIIEDSSRTVKVSSFDGERRDVAITALKELLRTGTVTPARIEAEVARARQSLSSRSKDAGYAALESVGVGAISPDLVHLLGRLRFRSSYTQNVLDHSIETAHIAGMIADELGLDSVLARRAGLLHDIGKILTPAQRGSHAALGAKLAQEHGESPEVVNAIAAHHGDGEPATMEAVLVQIADSISAARPGARNDDAANYISRMEHIESEVLSLPGVVAAMVLSAGHQIRVVVAPDQIADNELDAFTDKLAVHLESAVIIPGEMVITVIRERRSSTTIG
jgi:ribonuclease Y